MDYKHYVNFEIYKLHIANILSSIIRTCIIQHLKAQKLSNVKFVVHFKLKY